MATRLRKLRITKVDLVDKGAAVGARVTLYKRHVAAQSSGGNTVRKGVEMDLSAILASLPEEQRKVIEAAIAAAKSPAPAEKSADEEKSPEAAMKRLPEDARMAIESQQAELKKRLDEASARVAQLEDETLTREIVAKSTSLAKGAVGISAADLSAILKSLAKGQPFSKTQAESLEKHFAATASLLSSSEALREIGGSGPAPGSAGEQLRAIAKRMREATPDMSEATALDKAAQSNPKLYADARREER